MTYPEDKPKNKPKNTLSTGEKLPLHTETLMEIFNFSQATLNQNRNGSTSNIQKDYLKSNVKNDADAMWLMLMIMLGTAIVVGLIMLSRGIPMEYLAMGAGIIILPILWIGYRQQSGARKDLDNMKVKSVAGQAQVLWLARGTHLLPVLRVNDETFEIEYDEAKAMEQFDMSHLRVYYTEHSKHLLSAEVIAPPPTKNKLTVDDLLDEDTDALVTAGRKYDERQA